jgi:hypothetical protein
MITDDRNEQVLWMADCYSLAKRFPNPGTWMSLLGQDNHNRQEDYNPFHYWLWMEIWKASHSNNMEEVA